MLAACLIEHSQAKVCKSKFVASMNGIFNGKQIYVIWIDRNDSNKQVTAEQRKIKLVNVDVVRAHAEPSWYGFRRKKTHSIVNVSKKKTTLLAIDLNLKNNEKKKSKQGASVSVTIMSTWTGNPFDAHYFKFC